MYWWEVEGGGGVETEIGMMCNLKLGKCMIGLGGGVRTGVVVFREEGKGDISVLVEMILKKPKELKLSIFHFA